MFSTSAAYNLSRPCRRKEVLRRVDHATIFMMIAGTYTPFAVACLQSTAGLFLCVTIWLLATIGAGVTLAYPHRFERLLLALYLAMGWLGLAMGPAFLRHFSIYVLLLLLAGGVAYSVGALIYSWRRFPFQNAIWHALVVFGAGLHWVAVAQLLPPPISSQQYF
jgi:hemolysin III